MGTRVRRLRIDKLLPVTVFLEKCKTLVHSERPHAEAELFELHDSGSSCHRAYASTLAKAQDSLCGVAFDKTSMATNTYVLFAITPKSEATWRVLSILYKFRLDHGTRLDLILLTYMLVPVLTVFWWLSTTNRDWRTFFLIIHRILHQTKVLTSFTRCVPFTWPSARGR
jgi:hypothetical protein